MVHRERPAYMRSWPYCTLWSCSGDGQQGCEGHLTAIYRAAILIYRVLRGCSNSGKRADMCRYRACAVHPSSAMMRLLWMAVIGPSMFAHCTATETMEGCKIAIMDFNDPAFGLPPCDEEIRYRVLLLLHVHLVDLCCITSLKPFAFCKRTDPTQGQY